MAKWRAIHSSIATDEDVNLLSEPDQNLYTRMVVMADDWGIVTGKPFGLKLLCIPASSRTLEEIDGSLQQMEERSLIWRYQPDGYGPLVQVRKFDDHQPGELIRKRTAPKLPLHPDWRPMPSDERSAKILQESPGFSCLDKTRVEKSKEDKNSKRDPRLDHPSITGYRKLARLHVPIALRDEWIECAGKVTADHLLAVVKEWIGRGYNPRNVQGMMKVAREGWNDATHQRGDDKSEPSDWVKKYGHRFGPDATGS